MRPSGRQAMARSSAPGPLSRPHARAKLECAACHVARATDDQAAHDRATEDLVDHLAVMAELHAQARYDRMTDDLFKLTGKMPTSVHDFVRLHATEFRQREATAWRATARRTETPVRLTFHYGE